MKVLILLIALACISSTFAVSLRMKNHKTHKAHQASQENDFDKVAYLRNVIEMLDSLINDPEGSKEFLARFVEDDEEVTKDQLFDSFNEWSTGAGLGELDRAEIDAIFDRLDKDGNGVLSVDELSEGGAEIFGWLRGVFQNLLDEFDSSIDELRFFINFLDQLIKDPEARKTFVPYLFENDEEEVSKDEFFEALKEWTTSEGLEEPDRAEIDAIFDRIDKDGNGVLTIDAVTKRGAPIFRWIRKVAQKALDDAIKTVGGKNLENDNSVGTKEFPQENLGFVGVWGH